MLSNIDVLFRNLNDGPRTLEGNEIEISHEGALTDVLINLNEPPISAQSEAIYAHDLSEGGNQYVYDTSLADDELIFDVSINLGTADFGPTATNNRFQFRQTFFTHYSYDDGSAEAGFAVAGTGSRLALKYTNFLSDSVWALRIYTMPIGVDYENTTFTIKIWEDDGGVPGAEIASAPQEFTHGFSEYQELVLFQFEEPVLIPSGTFFVGYQQSSQASGLRVGLDFNTIGNDGNLYFDDGSGWQLTTIAAQASVMIHPMFTTEGYQDIVASTSDVSEIPGVRLFPNPSSGLVNLTSEGQEPLKVTVFDLHGRVIDQFMATSTFDVSDYIPGLYLIRLSDSRGRQTVKKLSVER
jgi:hypothetical protein